MLFETYFPRSEAARLLHVKESTIEKWVRAGMLQGEDIGQELLVDRISLTQLQAARRQQQRERREQRAQTTGPPSPQTVLPLENLASPIVTKCMNCRRKLRTETSKQLLMGPACYRKFLRQYRVGVSGTQLRF